MNRRWLTGLCLVTSVVPLTLGAVTTASAGTSSSTGHFLTPFREDGAHYDAGTDTFSGGFAKGGKTDANGCVAANDPGKQTGAPAGNPNAYDCLPAGASMVQLPNGKVAFWNALEGEEAITGTNSVLLDGGRLTVNDESRVLDNRGTPSFSTPSPVDAGAHQTDHPDDLPLGPLSAQHYAYNNGSMFCSDQVLLANGDVIDVGGTDYYTEPYIPAANTGVVELQGVKNSRIFNAAAQQWTAGPKMNYGRWYPALVTLGNGNLFVASGVDKLVKPVYPTRPADSGTNLKQTETLDLSAKTPAWVKNASTADKSLPLFPRLHLLPDGHVYYDAAGQDFNPFGQSYDEALWEVASTYDPAKQTWTDLGIPGGDPAYLLAHPDKIPYAGFRGSTSSAALTMRPSGRKADGTPVYTAASYLTAGGVLGTSPGSYLAVADSRISTVDTKGGTEKLSTVPTGDLNQGRWYGTTTPLPNGQVFLTSGANVDEVDLPGSESPIRSTELFTPTVDRSGAYTGGTWQKVGDQARKRTYHNNAVLQPDGSVLIGGHAPISTGYFQTTDTPDLPGRPGTNNHHDPSFQVWQPPYVGDPARPVVDGVTATNGGTRLIVHTADAAKIASVVLMRNTAETHLVDGDGRTVSLPVLSRNAGAGTVTVALPDTTNVLPNGPYLLYANKSKTADMSGTNAADLLPSKGSQLFVTGYGKDTTPSAVVPAAAAPTHAALARAAGANQAGGTQAGGTRVVGTQAGGTRAGGTQAGGAQAGSAGTSPARTLARSVSAPATAGPSLDLAADRRRSGNGDLPPAVPVAAALVTAAAVAVRRSWRTARRQA